MHDPDETDAEMDPRGDPAPLRERDERLAEDAESDEGPVGSPVEAPP